MSFLVRYRKYEDEATEFFIHRVCFTCDHIEDCQEKYKGIERLTFNRMKAQAELN